ncbi:hypothetical protein MHU86_20194 [Fragilaria crotonensis]|nr:hypothetical protein MHU86_20194 [Fragilaria crotonensis]
MASLSSRALSRLRTQHVTGSRLTRAMSSQPAGGAEDEPAIEHPQKFVQMRFEPGEWDPDRRDPLFRPPFKSRAKIMSAEDFAERPRVGFEEEFDSLGDAMITLTWLDAAATSRIYDKYLEMMSKATSVTSHEYVMRVLAQHFNLTHQRVASIVELAHREEQHRRAGRQIHDDIQDLVDAKVRDHIDKAYAEFRETDPEEFVEDPLAVTGIPNREYLTGSTVPVEDTVDVDGLMKAALIRETAEARLKIDGHIYCEDVDEETIFVRPTKETSKLMKARSAFRDSNDPSQRPESLQPMPGNEQPRRSRWKFAAFAVNTREAKKKKISLRRKQNDVVNNVIVEHDGELRLASVAEVKATSWKPVRDLHEFTHSSVKAAWLARTLKGEKGGWGRQKAPGQAAEEADEVGDESVDDEGTGVDEVPKEEEISADDEAKGEDEDKKE